MVKTTYAVPLEVVERSGGPGSGGPLCPACRDGRLHPYRVTFDFGFPGWQNTESLDGWVAVCRGNKSYLGRWKELWPDIESGEDVVPPCGFSMQMTPTPTRLP